MAKQELKYTAKNGVVLTYMEDPFDVENQIGLTKLLVIFQSLGDEKSDEDRKKYPYTLIDGLKFYNCRKIYIKDDRGLAGDYYLGLNGQFSTQEAVVEFLSRKIKEYNIHSENIITLGFSKGGYAAILFAYLLNIKTVISAVPQFCLDKWIYKYKPFLDYIYPNEYSDHDRVFYDNYLKNVILKSPFNPNKIYLITSHKDVTYNDHIPLLLESLDAKKTTYKIFHNDEYVVSQHNNVVRNSLNEILTILGYELSEKSLRNLLD